MTITAFTAYKDTSGKLHTSLESVQTAERRALYADILKAGTSANPQLARLDPTLVVDFCMALGKSIGDVANDRLAPVGENATTTVSAAVAVKLAVAAAEKLTPATPARKSEPESESSGEKGGRFGNGGETQPGVVGGRFSLENTLKTIASTLTPERVEQAGQRRAEARDGRAADPYASVL